MRDLCDGAAVRPRRLPLRPFLHCRLLHEHGRMPHADRSSVRRPGRRVFGLRSGADLRRDWQVCLQRHVVQERLLRRQQPLPPLRWSGGGPMRNGRTCMFAVRERAGVWRCRYLRMHHRVVRGRMLQGCGVRAASQSGHHCVRLGRQHLRHVRLGASVRERRLQLRRRVLLGMLLGGRVRAVGPRHVWRGRRRVRGVRAEATVQRGGQVRLQSHHLPQRVLRRGSTLRRNGHHQRLRYRGQSMRTVRRRPSVQRRSVCLQPDVVSHRLL